MDKSESSFEIKETPSTIVRIAYRQLSIMTGTKDLASPTSNNGNNKLTKKEEESCMVCTGCFFRLPIFLSVTSSLCQAYKTVKRSHESVTIVFDSLEDGLSNGAEYVSPMTNLISETLKTPMKTIHNFVCIGLDFLEEKVPSIKLPPYETFQNISNNVRQIASSTVNTFVIMLTNIVGYVDQLEAFMDKDAKKKDDKNNNIVQNVK